jgi:hypothetical protein
MLAASTLATPAVAAETADMPSQQSAAPAAFSVQRTLIADILKSAKAKAVLEKHLPGLRPFYGRISDLTLAEVAQSSHGLLGDAKLKAVQAGFDSIR